MHVQSMVNLSLDAAKRVKIESEHEEVSNPFFENQFTIVDFPEAFLPVKPISMLIRCERMEIVIAYVNPNISL